MHASDFCACLCRLPFFQFLYRQYNSENIHADHAPWHVATHCSIGGKIPNRHIDGIGLRPTAIGA
jgi:hypothetical protein